MRSLLCLWTCVCVLVTLSGSQSPAFDPEPGGALVRVVDCGAGLACIVVVPGANSNDEHRYAVFDAGHWSSSGRQAVENALSELIPHDEEIDLMVLSHPDSDHLASVPAICRDYKVTRILHTGYPNRNQATAHQNAMASIEAEVIDDGCIEMNLQDWDIEPGYVFDLGGATMTFICGFSEPMHAWGLSDGSVRQNSVSIVMRLECNGRSVLFTGDAIGRNYDDPDGVVIATEGFIVPNAADVPVDSDVLIVPHHGGNNASSQPFIEAVSPTYVIFSAGSRHHHPRWEVARRYYEAGLRPERMFRTDLGDDERKPGRPDLEWRHGRIEGHRDRPGDDDVDILITPHGNLFVQYERYE